MGAREYSWGSADRSAILLWRHATMHCVSAHYTRRCRQLFVPSPELQPVLPSTVQVNLYIPGSHAAAGVRLTLRRFLVYEN